MSDATKTLFERLGGYSAIAAVANDHPTSAALAIQNPIRRQGNTARVGAATQFCEACAPARFQ